MSNNPRSKRAVTLDTDLVIANHNCVDRHAAGSVTTIGRNIYRLCQDPVVNQQTSSATKTLGLITIPAGEYAPVAVPAPTETHTLTLGHANPLLYLTGSTAQPVVQPDDLDNIQSGAPVLATKGETVIDLLANSANPVTEILIYNCSQEDQKVQLCWEGVGK